MASSKGVLAVVEDYHGRRRGILRALGPDADKFFADCDPERENLCLFGYPSGDWAVDTPSDEVPPEMPEPCLGINFARDGMQRDDWTGLVAVHSDAWLLAVAFYKGARFSREEREELFAIINKVPTCYEVVSGRAAPSDKDDRATGVKRQSAGQGGSRNKQKQAPSDADDDDDDDDDDEDAEAAGGEWENGEGDPCPQCGRLYQREEFWIACDFCDAWYCGRCSKMTEAKAQRVRSWRCTPCTDGNP